MTDLPDVAVAQHGYSAYAAVLAEHSIPAEEWDDLAPEVRDARVAEARAIMNVTDPRLDSPRCPECGTPTALHHDPGCGQPCGACEAAAPATVTVGTLRGADVLTADRWQRGASLFTVGALQVFSGDKPVAEYLPGQWTYVAANAHRAPSGHGHKAAADGPDGILREIGEAVTDPGLTGPGQLDRVREILARWSETGK